MTRAGREQGGTEQAGREHWQRAVMCTFAGIFVVSLLAGLLGRATRGTLAVASAAGDAHATTTSPPRGHSPSDGESRRGAGSLPVSPQAAAQGQRALLQLADLPAGWVSGAAPRRRPACRPGPRHSPGASA